MKPSRNEIKKMREVLKKHGFNICYSKWCNGKIKRVEDFSKGKHRCKQCSNRHNKETTEKYMPGFRRIKFKLKLGKICELCGCDNIYMLEFDHINQEEKSFSISTKHSTPQIIEESEKTRLLCIWCHRLHSKKQIEDNVLKSKDDYDYTEEENNEVIDIDNNKICTGEFCNGRLRNRKWFYKWKNKYSHVCKKCYNYNFSLKRIENRNYVCSIKMNIGSCQKCNKKITLDTICCFDFDHIDRKNKVIAIASLSQSCYDAKEKIDLEIKKCQLLCCYCHKKKTISDLNYTELDMKKLYRLDNKPDLIKNIICPECNGEKDGYSKICGSCNRIKTRKVKRPLYEVLMKEINETSYLAVGRKYGVTDNAIRKWVKNYEKNM